MTNKPVSFEGVITLDGPAASGKSSVAKQLAEKLDIAFVSSGLLYRAATFLVLTHGVDPNDEAAVLDLLAKHSIQLEAPANAENRIVIDNEDSTTDMHTTSVDETVSAVAALVGLRSWVNERLQEVQGSFVIDGRDMGTVVFPNAAYKFYLTATAHERAKRRVKERSEDISAIEDAIKLRDKKDEKQLVKAEDARHIDTSELTLEQVIEAVLAEVKR